MNYQLLQKLRSLGKDFFTTADLRKIFKQDTGSLYVTLSRCVKHGWLKRLKSGFYQLAQSNSQPDKLANQLYYPSYLSFESALSKHGILSQVPYLSTFATPKKTKSMRIAGHEIIFRQLKKALFFGYYLSGGIYIAEKEKALLDQLYLVSLGKTTLNQKELGIKEIDKKLFLKYSRQFPTRTQKLAAKLLKEAE